MVSAWPLWNSGRRSATLRTMGVLNLARSSGLPVVASRPMSSASGRRPMLWNDRSLAKGSVWQAEQLAVPLNRARPGRYSAASGSLPFRSLSRGDWSDSSVRS